MGGSSGLLTAFFGQDVGQHFRTTVAMLQRCGGEILGPLQFMPTKGQALSAVQVNSTTQELDLCPMVQTH